MPAQKEAACPHCGTTVGRERCAADPYINKEPREYCSVAREHAVRLSSRKGIFDDAEGRN
jgi:hypothetical protein